MKLAYTMAPGRGDTDLVLERLAADLAARDLRCCGTVQINSERADAGPCDMDVRVLPAGAVLRISQDLGPQARGCRLDPAALETAVAMVAASLSSGADLLIVNKFGKHEAEERTDGSGEGGHQKQPFKRTRPMVSPAPPATASTATPMRVLSVATVVQRLLVSSQ